VRVSPSTPCAETFGLPQASGSDVTISFWREFWEALEKLTEAGFFFMHSGMQVEDKAKK